MAVKNVDELLIAAKQFLGDNESDEAIAFLEDIKDSYKRDTVNWEDKYNELDKMWRKKYKERFFEKIDKEEDKEDFEEKEYKYENLFKEGV